MLDFSKSEKHGWCEFCSCPGLLEFVTALEMYLCHDCKIEYEDADEVIHFADWFPDDEEDDDKHHSPKCTCELCIQNYPEREVYLPDEAIDIEDQKGIAP